MRIVNMAGLVGLLSLAPVVAAAQAIAINTEKGHVMALSTAKLSATEKAVLAADASWAQAYQSCDMTLMDKVLHDDIMFIHAHARVDTKQIVMKEFRACTNEQTITEPLRVLVTGRETGVVEARMKTRGKGRQDWIQFLYTRVYVRLGSDWRMIAHQTTFQAADATPGEPGVTAR